MAIMENKRNKMKEEVKKHPVYKVSAYMRSASGLHHIASKLAAELARRKADRIIDEDRYSPESRRIESLSHDSGMHHFLSKALENNANHIAAEHNKFSDLMMPLGEAPKGDHISIPNEGVRDEEAFYLDHMGRLHKALANVHSKISNAASMALHDPDGYVHDIRMNPLFINGSHHHHLLASQCHTDADNYFDKADKLRGVK